MMSRIEYNRRVNERVAQLLEERYGAMRRRLLAAIARLEEQARLEKEGAMKQA